MIANPERGEAILRLDGGKEIVLRFTLGRLRALQERLGTSTLSDTLENITLDNLETLVSTAAIAAGVAEFDVYEWEVSPGAVAAAVVAALTASLSGGGVIPLVPPAGSPPVGLPGGASSSAPPSDMDIGLASSGN